MDHPDARWIILDEYRAWREAGWTVEKRPGGASLYKKRIPDEIIEQMPEATETWYDRPLLERMLGRRLYRFFHKLLPWL